MNKTVLRNSLLWLILVIIAVILVTQLVSPLSKKTPETTLSGLVTQAQNREIDTVLQQGEALIGLKESLEVSKTSFVGSTEDLRDFLQQQGVTVGGDNGLRLNVKSASGFSWTGLLLNVVPIILLIVLFLFFFRSARGANTQAFNFGRSRARLFNVNKPTVTFADVAGIEEAKQELHEIVDFLKSPQKFQALGARIPRGVLLVGPPGTGKTLLARAIAGEAGVPFFSISGSEFVEMFVGVGASRVRDLFDQAKHNAPCILFVDEIDAVGRHRGAGLGGSHDEREQTLNQILVEMDGFDSNTNIIVLAATNRPDILDPALLRPGRFDRQVVLDRPDIAGRTGILKVHTRGKPIDSSVQLEKIAKLTPGFSGADLANLVYEAAILAARRDKKTVGMSEFEEAVDRVVAGPEKKTRVISPREKEITAYHEAGHALVAHLLPNADPVHKISIVARGMMGGYTRLLPTEDRSISTRSQFEATLAVFLAGRVSELLVFSDYSTGAQSDLESASALARKMVTKYGMSEKLGPRTFGKSEEMVFLGREITEQRNYSEKVALDIDREVSKFIEEADVRASAILQENRATLDKLAERLVNEETLEGAELEAVLGPGPKKEEERPLRAPMTANIPTPAPQPA
ncbi:MAG: ATP-dependent metallopeptidase FtsH/Yme1/Tma family protein [Chloroflexi bacterium]|nr:ATP-dependent metallopeptidase FtsH/Yme1/Tma family protein [Chloroflexota bacterium]